MLRCNIGSISPKMYISHQRNSAALIQQSLFDVFQIFRFLHPLRRKANNFGARFHHPDTLCYRTLSIIGVGIGHGLQADRIFTAQENMPDMHRMGLRLVIIKLINHFWSLTKNCKLIFISSILKLLSKSFYVECY